ncbi:MAG TPA: PQQ-dependent sugar dehydrogenase [Thermoanaerobaculia bacterium]
MRKLGALSLLVSFAAFADLHVPAGHRAQVFATDLEQAGELLTLEDGTVLVSRPKMNDVIALRDRDGDGRADEARTAVASVEQAHGLAMRGRVLYVAGVKKVVAAERLPDGSFAASHDVITDLPNGGRHPYRTIGAGPDGRLYVAIGSSCDDCEETNPEYASILQFEADGSNRRIYARGLQNPRGLAWHRESGELWSVDDGEVNRVGDGLHYGWPLCSGKRAVVASSAIPEGISKEKFCKSTEAAALELPAQRVAGFTLDGGFAFAALPSKIVRMQFDGRVPRNAEDYVTGVTDAAAVAVARDGALLIAETNGTIYRVSEGEMPMTSASVEIESIKPVLTKAFAVTELRNPVAVVHDDEQDVYFVSNVNGSPATKDGNGFISRITPDGKIAQLKFIDGLDAPKGLTIRGTELWIADIDRVLVHDRVSGARIHAFDLAPHGAVFLEDIAAGPNGVVYVTDTDVTIKGERERVRGGDGRIFRVDDDGDVEVALRGEELRSPSGIAWDGTRFLVAQAYGNEVLAWNPGMRTTAVLRGPGAYDGIVVLPGGAVIVSSHYDEALHIARNGTLEPLFARRPSPGDIGFDTKRNRLLIPSSDGDWLEAWTLPPMAPTQTTTSAKEGRSELARRD